MEALNTSGVRMRQGKPRSSHRHENKKRKSTFVLRVYRELPAPHSPKPQDERTSSTSQPTRYDAGMDKQTLIAALDFSRNRLNGTIDAIEKSGQDAQKVLSWRPGPARAHIGWQLAHCAATHDRYLNRLLKGGEPEDPAYCDDFGGGSTPSDTNVPTIRAIREKLAKNFEQFKSYIAGLQPADLDRKVTLPNGNTITVGEGALMMMWHEAHHQGQVHLTWNMYKAAHGVK